MPNALGAEGPRNYLLMFDNNAELRTQGGNPAALALVTIDAGAISIEQQLPGSFIPAAAGSVVPVSGDEQALYGADLGTTMKSTTSVPDFATTAQMAKSLWEAAFDTDIDAVVMVDPRALAYVLEAIGPVPISASESITSANVVDILLRESYSRFATGDEQDAFFTGVTASVFVAVATGQGSFVALVDRLVTAVGRGADPDVVGRPDEQSIFEAGPIGGAFDADTASDSRIGVFLNDRTGVKLGYYLDASVLAEADRCNAEDSPVTVTLDLTSALRGRSRTAAESGQRDLPRRRDATRGHDLRTGGHRRARGLRRRGSRGSHVQRRAPRATRRHGARDRLARGHGLDLRQFRGG